MFGEFIHRGSITKKLLRRRTRCTGWDTDGEQDIELRIALMGGSAVGKTALLEQFLRSEYPLSHRATVDQLHRLRMPLKKTEDTPECTLTLDLLDTSGSYEFPAMRRLAIQSFDAFVLVFSLDDPDSFEQVSVLRDEVIQVKREQYNRPKEQGCCSKAGLRTHPGFSGQSIEAQYRCNYTESRQQMRRHSHAAPDHQRPRETARRYSSAEHALSSRSESSSNIPSTISTVTFRDCPEISNRSSDHGLSGTEKPIHDHLNCLYVAAENTGDSIEECNQDSDAFYSINQRIPPIVVVGNKCDLTAERRVNRAMAETLVTCDWDAGYVECSAKLDLNVLDIFKQLITVWSLPTRYYEAIQLQRRRRMSLPASTGSSMANKVKAPKRNSCALS